MFVDLFVDTVYVSLVCDFLPQIDVVALVSIWFCDVDVFGLYILNSTSANGGYSLPLFIMLVGSRSVMHLELDYSIVYFFFIIHPVCYARF